MTIQIPRAILRFESNGRTAAAFHLSIDAHVHIHLADLLFSILGLLAAADDAITETLKHLSEGT